MRKSEHGIERSHLDGWEGLHLEEFDAAQHLTSKEAIAAYMTEVMATGDPAILLSAMNDVVRAHGMGRVAKEAGITREGAYKALRQGSKPRFDTIAAMLDALGLTLQVVPKKAHGANHALPA